MRHVYRLAAHKLVSDIELPELSAWDGRGDGTRSRGDLCFRLGKAKLDSRNGRYVVKGRDRITVENGTSVTIEPAQGSDLTRTRSLLMGPIQAVLWHQRGLLPLHGSAVSIARPGTANIAVALTGPSHAGKSTLAAALSAKGHPTLADDICIVDARSAELLTGQRRLRLWRDALDGLGIKADGLPRALSLSEKYLVETDASELPDRTRLAHVFLLSRQRTEGIEVRRLKASQATVALHQVVQMMPAAESLGLGAQIFTAVTALQAHGVMVWRLSVPDDLTRLDRTAEAVLARLDG
ncbi:MAG: hypothetical protein ACREFW_06985 [Rhizomicrobium sp.]